MTIWILALIIFGCLGGIGYQQGAIRVGISFVGIIVAALLAGPLGKLVKPVVAALSVVNPILLWLIPPFVAFIVVLSVFKVIGYTVHRKVDVYYRHKAGDLRLALWERINARLGLCLGLLNGLAYLVLISMVIYPLSYLTVQMASPDGDTKLVKLTNRMGHDLQKTGMARVARAIDPMPDVYYDAADLTGLLYQNSLLEARLSRYPAFLTLADKQEFQNIAHDTALTEARLRRAPVRELLKNPNVQAIVNSPDMLKTIWGIVSPDLKDLMLFLTKQKEYLDEGKYKERVLGRWYFDLNGTMAAYRRSKPNVTSSEMQKIRTRIGGAYAKTMMVASPDHQIVMKNYPQVKQQPGQPPSLEMQTLRGHWKGQNEEYDFTIGGAGEQKAKLESGRLVVSGETLTLVFTPED
jgi:hypothetical protein